MIQLRRQELGFQSCREPCFGRAWIQTVTLTLG